MNRDQMHIRIKNEYRAAHNGGYASLRTMLEWAREAGLFDLDMTKAWAYAIEEFASSLRGEMTTDSQGNEIRVNIPFLDPQKKLWQWDQRDTISHEHMQINVSQAWRQVYSDIRANCLSINDYHERHQDRPALQFSLDFAGALADDGIKAPSSIELERLIAPPPTAPQE